MKLIVLAVGLLIVSAPALSQLLAPGTPSPCVDGSEKEYQEFISNQGLDKLTEAQRDRLLGVSVKHCKVEDNPVVLEASYTFKPTVVQENLCLMVSYLRRKSDPASDFERSGTYYSAWVMDDGGSCHLTELPKKPIGVRMSQPLPSAVIKIIIESTDLLVEVALKNEHVRRAYSQIKEPIDRSLFRIFRVELNGLNPMAESSMGVTYKALLSDGFRHSAVDLSITGQGIKVHAAGIFYY